MVPSVFLLLGPNEVLDVGVVAATFLEPEVVVPEGGVELGVDEFG